MPSLGIRLRAARLALCAVLLACGASAGITPSPAVAAGVEFQAAIATGLATADRYGAKPLDGKAAGKNPYCTAEPTSTFYGSTTFDPALGLSAFGAKTPGESGYVPPNLPSSADMDPALVSGSHSDFCIGFTLTPNADPAIIRTVAKPSGTRIQPTTPYPDVPETRVADDARDPVDGDDMDRIVIDLPSGYVGSLASVPTCATGRGAFGAGDWIEANCPAASQIGDVYVRIHSLIARSFRSHVVSSGSVIYNLAHSADEIGLLGVQVQPFSGVAPVKFLVRLTLSPDGSGRIRTIVENAPRIVYGLDDVALQGDTWRGTTEVLQAGDLRIGQPQPDSEPYPLYIESVGFRIWGAKEDHPTMQADFGEMPTQCSADISARLSITTYDGSPSTIDSPGIRMSDCAALDFRPALDVSTTERQPGVPTGVTVGVDLGQNPAGSKRVTSLLKDAIIRLPRGLELGAQVASVDGGLRLCRADEFNAADQLAPSTCKEGSAVGTVSITSPLIDYPFVGTVFLGEQRAVGELPDLYVEASPNNAVAPDAPRIKLVANVSADPVTGQITTAFLNNPQLRFSRIEFNFPAGPTSFFTTPPRCGTYTGDSTFAPSSGQPSTDARSVIAIDQNCAIPFAPTVSVSSANPVAGARSQTRIEIERPDRGQWLSHLTIALPTGLLADLTIPTECPAAQVDAGTCPQSSRLGTVTALAGAGEKPWNLAGAMYLASRLDGDVAGAAIVVRAAVGDLDLGNVIVRGRIQLRPTDAGLVFEADVPTRFRGVALQLRRVVVDMDRSNLMLNPTACGPVPWGAAITADSGEVASIPGALAFTDCDRLPFNPTLNAQITGENKPGGHPGMYVRLDSPVGDSALKTAAVTLPEGVAVDLDNVKTVCSRADFDAVRCPAATRVGSVTAFVSITNEPVTGDIYLIRVEGKSLPGLGLNFTGRYAQRVVSTTETTKDQRILVTFPTIPDLPLRRLIVQVDSSARSPLELPKSACASGTNWTGAFVGQGGQTAKAETGLQCAGKANIKLTDRGGLSMRLFDFGGRKLRALKITLPSGWSLDRKLATRRKDLMWVRVTGGSAKLSVTDHSLIVTARGKSVSTIRLKLSGAAVRPVTRAAKRAKRARPRLRLVFTDGAVQLQKPAVTVRK